MVNCLYDVKEQKTRDMYVGLGQCNKMVKSTISTIM